MAANIRTIGLSGLARALVQNDRLRDAEAERLTQEAKAEQASFEGVRDLRQAGLLKAKQGLTSLEEVMAVTNE